MLSEGPGNSRTIPLILPQRVQVDNDLYLDALEGKLVLSRTGEGILIQGSLRVSHRRECGRCLEAFVHSFDLDLAEMFASPPDSSKSVFSVDSNGEIDLAPLLREEVLIEESYRSVCREDCRGLSARSGRNLNTEEESRADVAVEAEAPGIDPRMAVLKTLLK